MRTVMPHLINGCANHSATNDFLVLTWKTLLMVVYETKEE